MSVEIKVLVPEDRIAEFYQFFGSWLAGNPLGQAEPEQAPVEWEKSDLVRAIQVWDKLSDRAKGMFSVLIDSPGQKFTAAFLAESLDIPNGMYGVAGVLAWPGRHSLAVGRVLPVMQAEGPVGEGASYWMNPEVAQLFKDAREGIK